MTELRGIGDRWIAGEPLEGVAFAHGAAVGIVTGEYAGSAGRVLLLVGLRPEPRYLVHVIGRGVDVRIPQSALAPEASGAPRRGPLAD